MRIVSLVIALVMVLSGMGISALLLAHALQRARQEGYEAARLTALVAAHEQDAQRQQLAHDIDARAQQRIVELQRSHDALLGRYHAMLDEAARGGAGDGPCLESGIVRGLDALGR